MVLVLLFLADSVIATATSSESGAEVLDHFLFSCLFLFEKSKGPCNSKIVGFTNCVHMQELEEHMCVR